MASFKGQEVSAQSVGGFEIGRTYELSLTAMARQYGSYGNDLEVVLDAGLGTEIVLIDIAEVTFDEFTKVVSGSFVATKSTYTLTLGSDRDGGNLTGDRTVLFDDVRFNRIAGVRVPSAIVLDGSALTSGHGLNVAVASLISSLTINNFVGGAGINLEGSGRHVVEYVWSGVHSNGIQAAPNEYGIKVQSPSNTIRSSIFSGNLEDGIFINGVEAASNVVAGNFVGTDWTGQAGLANGSDGIQLVSGSNSVIFFNIISFNSENGVNVIQDDATGNRITVNSIHANGSLGIDLGSDGVTANDRRDADLGPNELTNFPVIASAKARGLSNTTIKGGIIGTPNTVYRVEFYANEGPSAVGYGQGQQYLMAVNLESNSSGRIKFSTEMNVEIGKFVSAIAIDPFGNTSEFSASREVKPEFPFARYKYSSRLMSGRDNVKVKVAERMDDQIHVFHRDVPVDGNFLEPLVVSDRDQRLRIVNEMDPFSNSWVMQ